MLRKTIIEGEKELKKGVESYKIFKAVNSIFIKNNKKLVHHAGHGIGENYCQEPIFVLENKTSIKENSFITLEMGVYDHCGIRIENDYFIGKNKLISLFEDKLPLDLYFYILK